jgi:acyl carrier protein
MAHGAAAHHGHSPSEQQITEWLTARLARELKISAGSVGTTISFVSYGLNSVQVVSLSGELELWLDREISPMLLWDHPTIEQLAHHLAEAAAARAS